jgi:hypothetical protein
MASDRSVVERQIERVELRPFTLDGFHQRRQRKERNRRIGSALVALVVVGATIGGLLRAFSSGPVPVADPRRPFLGTWVATDLNGSTQTMAISASGDQAVNIVVHDDLATVCSGAPSTTTGTGQVRNDTELVVPSPALTCDDGSEPQALSGPPLEEQLRNLTFIDHPESDTLTDTLGLVWARPRGENPSPGPTTFEGMWPQSSLEEVRKAQRLADAGDPRYKWQVDPELEGQVGQHHPAHGRIFARFIEEKLRWEGFRWDEAAAHPDGLDPGDVVYIRCGPGPTNPLYPTDPEDPGCAPTIDELRYETVKINVAQPDQQGPRGIWVVTGWQEIEPFEQVAPPSDAEITATLGAFLQARIDGEGAEGFADIAEYPFTPQRVDREIPLLYATSTGAPYERTEFDLVDGPVWPDGSMQFRVRLFAENDQTVVEQVFSLERDETGRLRLVYSEPTGLGEPGPGTTENGKAVPEEYAFLDGEVTYRAAYPAGPWSGYIWDQGPEVATVLGAHERRLLLLLADPQPIEHPGCVEAPAPADAEALARSIRSNPDLVADAPVAVTIGGIPALQMDVKLAPDASACPWQMPNMSSSTPLLLKHAPVMVQGADRARLYLLDLPGGSARVLAIAIMSDEDSIQRALKLTAPIVDSIEFHAR